MQIVPMMTTEEIEQEIHILIVPETADEQARSLVRLLSETTNFENADQANAAQTAMMAAFRETSCYERAVKAAFREFVREAQMPAMNGATKKSDDPLKTESSQVH